MENQSQALIKTLKTLDNTITSIYLSVPEGVTYSIQNFSLVIENTLTICSVAMSTFSDLKITLPAINEFKIALENTLTTLETNDFVSFADILEHELSPTIKDWIQLLEEKTK